MKRVITLFVAVTMVAAHLAADTNEPQIAFRILDEYVREKQENAGRERTIGVVALIAGGVSLVALGGVIYFYGDELNDWALSQDPSQGIENWNDNVRTVLASVSAGVGVVSLGLAPVVALSPPHDYKADFDEIYTEDDPTMQEALAASALYDIAITGRNRRIRSAMTGLLTPVISTGITIGVNASDPEKQWYDGVFSGIGWSTPNIVSAIVSLNTKSDEETLYEKYIAARDVYLTRDE